MNTVQRLLTGLVTAALCCAAVTLCAEDKAEPPTEPDRDADAAARDFFGRLYGKYAPLVFTQFTASDEEMKLSSEKAFFTLNQVEESLRANALIEAGIALERKADFRRALDIYQRIIQDFPDALYRVNPYGVFVPAPTYCQMRMVRFPKEHLAFYRTRFDPRAREAFDQLRRKTSIFGLADLRDGMLATSCGGPTLLALGDAALDRGHYLEALEYYGLVRDWFPDKNLDAPELELSVQLCERMLGMPPAATAGASNVPSRLSPHDLAAFQRIVSEAQKDDSARRPQPTSAPYASSEDRVLLPATADSLALEPPVWTRPLSTAGEHLSYIPPAYSYAVATSRSVIYRHKNIVYCRSILNGELRWMCDIGGRVTWQSVRERQHPNEDVVVSDGLVFSAMHKIGPSLVALDEVTGELRWKFGPISPANEEEANMRFLAAPAVGQGMVFAAYVLDNIQGETHTDTEYGVIAFETRTGRVQWRRPICTLQPGQFSTGFAVRHRIKIRSFGSAPLYHENTVYCCTNAGVVAAVDATSGRVKWLIKYPYYRQVHDMTQAFGSFSYADGRLNPYGCHEPMFWANQRPFIVGEELYATPVDSTLLLCLDRKTGMLRWSRDKDKDDRYGGYRYLLGPTSEDHLVLVHGTWVRLVNRRTGDVVWSSPRSIKRETNPVFAYALGWDRLYGIGWDMNRRNFYLGAPPTLAEGDKLYCSQFAQVGAYDFEYTIAYALEEMSLKDRKITAQRLYYHPDCIGDAINAILRAPAVHAELNDNLPLDRYGTGERRQREEEMRKQLREVADAPFPENEHGPFAPFTRLTFQRYGVLFELRIGARSVSMTYDRARLDQAVSGKTDPESLFVSGELRLAENRAAEARGLFEAALARVREEDLDFRATINQQLYTVYKSLAQASVRSGLRAEGTRNCLGMTRNVTTLANEIESLFAVAEAYERNAEYDRAATALQSVIRVYGRHEYPVASLGIGEPDFSHAVCDKVLDDASAYAASTVYRQPVGHTMAMLRKGLGLYFSSLSPLEKDFTLQAVDLAAAKLLRLRKAHPGLAAAMDAHAASELRDKTAEEQVTRLPEFPASPAAQDVLDRQIAAADKTASAAQNWPERAAARRRMWELSDIARHSELTLPESCRAKVLAPPPAAPPPPVPLPLKESARGMQDEEGTQWFVLRRRDGGELSPDCLFLGGRIRKRLDRKFLVHCVDLKTGQVVWKGREQRGEQWYEEVRLARTGDETGFTEAFVVADVVVVHGLYDVLAFRLKDGALKWRYRVPFDFEIRHAILSGDLLVLAGDPETLALYIPTDAPNGEVAWQQSEQGALYAEPYFLGDRLVSVRRLPYNVTVRYRATGRLMGRLDLPSLSEVTDHPLVDGGPRELPISHDGRLLALSDSWYYVVIDVERAKVLWKRLIDANDPTREPPLRLALKGPYLAVLKKDFDLDAFYMLSSETGNVLWATDPKNPSGPRPIHSVTVVGDAVYGIGVHPGQAFYFVGMDCKTGRYLFPAQEQSGYEARPAVDFGLGVFGRAGVVQVKDRQDFELRAIDLQTGKHLHSMKVKGAGEFGEYGRASATVQNGRLILMGQKELKIARRD